MEEFSEALLFAIDALKATVELHSERIEVLEDHLSREHSLSFRAAETAHIGEAFNKKWAHLLERQP